MTLEQEVPGRDDSSISPNVEPQPGLKSPSSLSVWLSNMPTPQCDVYISAIWLDPNNIKSVNDLTETSVHCCSLMFVTPHSKNAMINPYHKYKPNYKSGRHWSADKVASTFDVCMAVKMALYRKTHSLIDMFMKAGDPEQQRHTLCQFLTHKRIIDDTKHVMQHVKLDKEATVGVHVLRSIKRILKNIFKSTNIGRISNQQCAWVNVLLACLSAVTIQLM